MKARAVQNYQGRYAPLVIFFFAAVFLWLMHPIPMGDFWWHLNTGKWIWTHQGLPSIDPFTYTNTEYDPVKAVLLKGYWLVQLFYYLIYSLAGFSGVVVMNAAVFSLIFITLWSLVRGYGMDSLFACVLIVPAVLLMGYFDEVRPHAFSFLAALILYALIDMVHREPEKGSGRTPKPLYFMPVVMLLWSNAHQGFVIGDGMLVINLGCLFLVRARRRMQGERLWNDELKKTTIWSAIAIAASLVNPASVNSPALILRFMSSEVTRISNFVPENLSPWAYSSMMGYWGITGALGVILVFTAFSLVRSMVKVTLTDAAFYICFAVAAAMSVRYAPFFALIATAMGAKYFPFKKATTTVSLRYTAGAASLVFAGYMAFVGYQTSYLRQSAYEAGFLPEGAADFIESNEVPENMFNPFEWGGYISWRLYPKYRVFIDARIFDSAFLLDFIKARESGRTRELFEKYGINTVIFNTVQPGTLDVPIVVLALLKNDEWKLIYYDGLSVILVRSGMLGNHVPVDKQRVFSDLIALATNEITQNPGNPHGYITLGRVYLAMGQMDKADDVVRRGRAIDPAFRL